MSSNNDIKPEVVQKTKKMLGKYVKKPVLTEKLLQKPPFRFLLDIIVSIIQESHFLKGLFSDNELKSTFYDDKDKKIAFLQKLISAVGEITQTELKVKPSKIVAGLEPGKTNILLQTIAKALDKKLDSSAYIAKLNGEKQAKEKKTKTSSDKDKDKIKTKTSKTKTVKKDGASPRDKKKVESPKQVLSEASSSLKVQPEEVLAEEVKKTEIIEQEIKEAPIKAEESPVLQEATPTMVEDQKIEQSQNKSKDEEASPIKRPLTAVRPKSARIKSGEKIKQPPNKNVLRPPSVRPTSARPGAPRLRPDSALPVNEPIPMGNINVIVESVDLPDDDNETVVIQNTELEAEEPNLVENLTNKGHLVEQILEQLNQEGSGDKTKSVEINWEQETGSISKEMVKLRQLIQFLTKTANPLGKLLNYLHEDLEAMYAELQMWSNVKKQLLMDVEKQRRMSSEADKPLLSHLKQLQNEIGKKEKELVGIRCSILRNEARLKEILLK